MYLFLDPYLRLVCAPGGLGSRVASTLLTSSLISFLTSAGCPTSLSFRCFVLALDASFGCCRATGGDEGGGVTVGPCSGGEGKIVGESTGGTGDRGGRTAEEGPCMGEL